MAMWAEHLPVVGSLHLAGPIGSCLAVARMEEEEEDKATFTLCSKKRRAGVWVCADRYHPINAL